MHTICNNVVWPTVLIYFPIVTLPITLEFQPYNSINFLDFECFSTVNEIHKRASGPFKKVDRKFICLSTKRPNPCNKKWKNATVCVI